MQQQRIFKKSLEVHRFYPVVSQKKQMSCDFSTDLLFHFVVFLPPDFGFVLIFYLILL